MENKFPYAVQGAKLTNMIKRKGMSIYKFSLLCRYSTSRMYRLCRGEDDIYTVQFMNILLIARVLGYKYVDDFAKDLGIDILEDLR